MFEWLIELHTRAVDSSAEEERDRRWGCKLRMTNRVPLSRKTLAVQTLSGVRPVANCHRTMKKNNTRSQTWRQRFGSGHSSSIDTCASRDALPCRRCRRHLDLQEDPTDDDRTLGDQRFNLGRSTIQPWEAGSLTRSQRVGCSSCVAWRWIVAVGVALTSWWRCLFPSVALLVCL